jgi:hypothetical protein
MHVFNEASYIQYILLFSDVFWLDGRSLAGFR